MTMEQELYNVIYEANYKDDSSSNDQVATTLAKVVMELYKASLLDDLDTPLQFGRCSFKRAKNVSHVDDLVKVPCPLSGMPIVDIRLDMNYYLHEQWNWQ